MVAWSLLTSCSAQWQRAGMSGTICGLDVVGCMNHPMAEGEDRELIARLLHAGEAGVVEAESRRQSSNSDDWHRTGGE